MARPDTRIALQNLIDQVRDTLPFDLPAASVCNGICNGCSKKLLDFLDCELLDWQQRLDDGEVPGLGDLDRLGRTCRKVYRVLERNGLVGG